jgi:hypothetical protein
MEILFNIKHQISSLQLFYLLLKDPRRFSDYIKFKTEPFDKDELYRNYKTVVENYLVAA